MPRSLYFSMISLEGAVTSSCCFHRTIPRLGLQISTERPPGPGPGSPAGPIVWQLQVPPLCSRRAIVVFLKRTEELAWFCFISFGFLFFL